MSTDLSTQETVEELNDLIVIEQYPVIRQRLKEIKTAIEIKVQNVLALECNEKTVKAIKVLRTDLNKDFSDLEGRRKEVKKAIMTPYDRFEEIYKDCVSSVFKTADAELKNRISEVEDGIKDEKRQSIVKFFEECKASKNIDFVDFDDSGINITLTSTPKALKMAVATFIDRIADDLNLIETQNYKTEILVEYKQSLNVSGSITMVTARHKAIEEECARIEQNEQIKQEQQETINKVMNATQDSNFPLSAPKTATDDDVIITNIGKIRAHRSDMRILKQLITNGKYEIIK